MNCLSKQTCTSPFPSPFVYVTYCNQDSVEKYYYFAIHPTIKIDGIEMKINLGDRRPKPTKGGGVIPLVH